MLFKNYKPILHLFFLAIATYIIHKGAFFVLKLNDQNFHYSIEILYLIFLVFATVLLIVVLRFKKDKFDSIGMFFMAGTFIQMFLSYLILRPILSDKIHNVAVEKTNFFVTFILFLLFETLLTVRLLNEKR
ncbi:hypothetical protein GKZ90_0001670 [Flavobacterium sp. MC2016-06]|uniref:hypothetical protein n=1 Tax=Flavobacterium sp. MC2016-06 TaxID=2676308 RepID=UPI0012BA5993|nr:hypothetical protein [Flavobacterium sp. MC2016-06]MBU3858978.1 hypothetical protein [Flavobacterium sp. MC2016-06]